MAKKLSDLKPGEYEVEGDEGTLKLSDLNPDDYKVEHQPKWYDFSLKGAADATETAMRSGLEMATLGLSEPVVSGLNAALHTAESGNLSLDELKKQYGADIERRKKMKAGSKVADMGGGLAGALMPQTLAAKTAGAVGKAVTPLLGFIKGTKGAGPLANLTGNAANMTKAGLEGAAQAFGAEAPRQTVLKNTGFMSEGEAPSLMDTTLMGGGIGAGGSALATLGRGAAKGAPVVGKKLMATFLGPGESHIEAYLKNPDAINNAKSLEELKGTVDNIVGDLRTAVEKGKTSVDEASSILKDIDMRISAHENQAGMDFQIGKSEISQAFNQAKKEFSEAAGQAKQALKEVKPPLTLADEATEAVKDLKKRVVKESEDAFKILNDADGHVNILPAYEALDQAANGLNIAGTGPVTAQAKAAQAEILNLKKSLDLVPSVLSFADTKKLIQQIDRSEKVIYDSGAFTDDVSNAFRNLRGNLDRQLKEQSPEYKKHMETVVAPLTRLHANAVDRFGDKKSALSILNRVGSGTSEVERDILSKLGKATGRDFDSDVAAYMQAQSTLKDPAAMQAIEQGLPQYGAMGEAERINRSFSRPDAKQEYVQNSLGNSGLLKERMGGLKAQEKAMQGFQDAETRLSPFRNITENNSESKLKALLHSKPGEKIEIKEQFRLLSELSDTDFERAVNALRTKEAFNGSRFNGSRNVNLFGLVAHAVGATAVGGALGGPIGAGVGGAMGAAVDIYGPQIAKKMLDGVILMGKSPTLDQIKRLQIPPAAQAYLARELAEYNGGGDSAVTRRLKEKQMSGGN